MKNVWIALAVALAVATVYLVFMPRVPERDEDGSDYDELVPCAFLTSIDSSKSLYLSRSHVARRSEATGVGRQTETGTWELLDEDARTYKVSINGTETTYTLVSAPEGEGCMLVPGDPKAANLSQSWFSTLQDPK